MDVTMPRNENVGNSCLYQDAATSPFVKQVESVGNIVLLIVSCCYDKCDRFVYVTNVGFSLFFINIL